MNLLPEIWGTWPASDISPGELELIAAALASGGELSAYPIGSTGTDVNYRLGQGGVEEAQE